MFYFKDNGELETLDGVPSEYHLFYVKGQDNKFRIKDDLKPITTNIDTLRTNLTTAQASVTRSNAESAERRQQLDTIVALGVGATAEEIKAKVDQMNKDLTDGKKINPDTIRAEVTAQFQQKLDDAAKATTEIETELTSVLVDDAVTRAIIANKGNVTLLGPVAKGKIAVIKDPNTGRRVAVGVNDKGEPLPGVDGGWMSPEKVVEGLKAIKDFAPAFEGTTQNGSGVQPRIGQPRSVTPGPVGQGNANQNGGTKSPMEKITAGLNMRQAGGAR